MTTSLPTLRHGVAAVLAALALPACATVDSAAFSPCDVTLEVLKPSSALAGEQVVARGRPFTSAYDTALYVGIARATLIALDREGCDDCDDCLDARGCSACSDDLLCADCDALCAACVETVTFEVPALEAGEAPVQIFNRHGASNTLTLDVLAPVTDTGPTDTGGGDSQPLDSGSGDTGPADTSGGETGAPDSAAPETGGPDTAQGDPD